MKKNNIASSTPFKVPTMEDLEKYIKIADTQRITNQISDIQHAHLEALAKALVEKHGFNIRVVTQIHENNKVSVGYEVIGEE